jgi:Domain of unknown function (DUF4126)
MEALPWVFSSGWASGINSYAVVLILGLAGRFLGVDGVPAALTRTDVLVAAAVLFAVDTVADKIPYIDSGWDVVHTAIRPTIGAILGVLLAGNHATTLQQATLAVTGGASALASHLVKAGLRAAVNTSPEPASNIVVSTAEDVTVAGVVSLSLLNPWIAAGIAVVLLGIGITIVLFVLGRIRRFRRLRRERRARTRTRA